MDMSIYTYEITVGTNTSTALAVANKCCAACYLAIQFSFGAGQVPFDCCVEEIRTVTFVIIPTENPDLDQSIGAFLLSPGGTENIWTCLCSNYVALSS